MTSHFPVAPLSAALLGELADAVPAFAERAAAVAEADVAADASRKVQTAALAASSGAPSTATEAATAGAGASAGASAASGPVVPATPASSSKPGSPSKPQPPTDPKRQSPRNSARLLEGASDEVERVFACELAVAKTARHTPSAIPPPPPLRDTSMSRAHAPRQACRASQDWAWRGGRWP